jgi:hypothetical protein
MDVLTDDNENVIDLDEIEIESLDEYEDVPFEEIVEAEEDIEATAEPTSEVDEGTPTETVEPEATEISANSTIVPPDDNSNDNPVESADPTIVPPDDNGNGNTVEIVEPTVVPPADNGGGNDMPPPEPPPAEEPPTE